MSDSILPTPVRVCLGEMTDDDFLLARKWFFSTRPETQTCRPISLKSDAEALQTFRERLSDETAHEFAVRRTTDGRFLGRVRYFELNPRNRSAEIGYLFDPDVWGQGYATEALNLLLCRLFVNLKLNKVYAQTAEFNAPSIGLLSRLGFTMDGRLRQHHEWDGKLHDDLVFSLLARGYQQLRGDG